MDEVKKERALAKRKYTRLENIIKKSIVDGEAATLVERRLKELSEKWESVQEEHDKLTSLCENEEAVAQEDEWLTIISDSFYALESEAHYYINKSINTTEIIESKYSPPQPDETKQSKNIQLERVKFQPFNGDIRKFPKFKEQFTKHIQPLCRDDQAAFILKSYLVEEVRDDVEKVEEEVSAI